MGAAHQQLRRDRCECKPRKVRASARPGHSFSDEAGNAEVRLVGRYAVSDRVHVRVDLEGTALDAPMRLAVTRMEIR